MSRDAVPVGEEALEEAWAEPRAGDEAATPTRSLPHAATPPAPAGARGGHPWAGGPRDGGPQGGGLQSDGPQSDGPQSDGPQGGGPRNDDLAARLRALFADPERLAALVPAAGDDRDRREAHPAPRRAAVLVPVVLGPEPSVLLTLRAATLSSHAGQVSFPGGRIEPGETPEAAAVREAAEEVGLDPRIPEILGRLPEHHTGTGFHVVPVLALIAEPPVLTPDPAEVAEAFAYPLARLLDPALPERRSWHWRGRDRDIWVWPHERHLVWGATAAMLRALAILLRGA